MNPLLLLALIPVVGVILFIYFNDKKEKEPFGFLISLFFLGMATVVSAIILELIGEAILNAAIPFPSVGKGFVEALLIVAPAEEMGKYVVLRLRTWKSKNFDFSYDAIVYAVFVSMGFAAFENVEYVAIGGIATAISRMLTAVPGHAVFAVYMGFFYGKAKLAKTNEENGKCILFKLLAMFVPILFHGIYDGILFAGEADDYYFTSTMSVILWICYVVVLFAASIVLIILASKHDKRVIPEPPVVEKPNIQPLAMPLAGSAPYFGSTSYGSASYGATSYGAASYGAASSYGSSAMSQQGWTCSCGSCNVLSFCPKCGNRRPVNNIWTCPSCGTQSTLNFCGSCGYPKPLGNSVTANSTASYSPYQRPVQSKINPYTLPTQPQAPAQPNPYMQPQTPTPASAYMNPQASVAPAPEPSPYAPQQTAAAPAPEPAPSPFVPLQPAVTSAPSPSPFVPQTQPQSSPFQPPVQNPPL